MKPKCGVRALNRGRSWSSFEMRRVARLQRDPKCEVTAWREVAAETRCADKLRPGHGPRGASAG
eukprot:9451289-Pyramimonas_sp.AAC.1